MASVEMGWGAWDEASQAFLALSVIPILAAGGHRCPGIGRLNAC